MSQATWAVAVGCALGGWPATGLLNGRASAARPTGARAARMTWHRETKLVMLGALLNTVQGSQTTHHPYTQTL